MPALGEYSDTLRALGRFLEMIGASEIGIIEQDDQVEVAWRGKGNARQERRYKEFELQALRTTARLLRGMDGGTPLFTTSEMLRTLGSSLDEMKAQRLGLVETCDGFYVSAEVDGERIGRLYTLRELASRAREAHEKRLAKQAEIPASSSSTTGIAIPTVSPTGTGKHTTPLLTRLAS